MECKLFFGGAQELPGYTVGSNATLTFKNVFAKQSLLAEFERAQPAITREKFQIHSHSTDTKKKLQNIDHSFHYNPVICQF